jgi:hypothetical protein
MNFLLASLIGIYACFCAFHWRWIDSPLTSENMETLSQIFETDTSNLESLFVNRNSLQPFYMVNSIKYKPTDGITAQATQEYNAIVLPKLLARACYPVFILQNEIVLKSHNANTIEFDTTIITRYRSTRDFFEIVTHPDFMAARGKKFMFMDSTIMLGTSPVSPVMDLSTIFPIVLLSIYVLFRK